MTNHRWVVATAAMFITGSAALGSGAGAPSGSLVVRMIDRAGPAEGRSPHALLDSSMFAISPPELRIFEKHDLVQIIVREASRAESDHELETEKDYLMRGALAAWPSFLGKISPEDLPSVDIGFSKEFEGEGEYSREDEFTTRLSAEVIDILPNGNLILEARTRITMDNEVSTIKVTGVCRPIDVTAANTVVSSQIHDLFIEKINTGDLKEANERGIIAKILDTIFAF